MYRENKMEEGITIPQDLLSLKRPALQKLCKKLGIRANVKNVEMVKALEEIRDSQTSAATAPAPIDPRRESEASLDAPILSTNCSSGEIKGKRKRKRRRGQTESLDDSHSEQLSTGTTSCLNETPPLLTDESPGTWLTASTGSSGPPDVSTASSSEEGVMPMEDHKQTDDMTPEISNPVAISQCESPHQLHNSPNENAASDPSIPVGNPTTVNSTPPFSPPDGDKVSQSSSKRKRNSTYTFETPEEQVTNTVEEQPPSKRMRRDTFSVSPKATSKLDDEINTTTTCTTPSGSGVEDCQALSGIMDVHSEIMNLLDKRVEEKLNDPNYKPAFSTGETMSCKKPPAPSTTKKFDSAHKKHFSRMRSIVSYHQDKERRTAAMNSGSNPHKRPKLVEKQPTQTSRIPKVTFKPSTLDIKQSSFNFNDKREKAVGNYTKTGSKTVISSSNKFGGRKSAVAASRVPRETTGVSETPSKVYTFTATSTYSSAKKPKLDANKSQKKKPTTYKPHTGRLPDFKFSRF